MKNMKIIFLKKNRYFFKIHTIYRYMEKFKTNLKFTLKALLICLAIAVAVRCYNEIKTNLNTVVQTQTVK